ncbi:hypothetical protein VF21_03688 [Pseudogymnoascus sp. 05NY08]|nr:hypothetical protein VF21_03688 [Pseudogymnoascus sp. 05NY08]
MVPKNSANGSRNMTRKLGQLKRFGYRRSTLRLKLRAVGSSCANLWLDNYICVSIVGTSPGSSPTTAEGNGMATPTLIQTGMTTKCKTFYNVRSGDMCATIAAKVGIRTAQFLNWNPAVNSDCSDL